MPGEGVVSGRGVPSAYSNRPSIAKAFDLAFDAKVSLSGSGKGEISASSGHVGFLGQLWRLISQE